MALITLREAIGILEQSGVLGTEVKQKEQAVKRLLNQGLILGEKPPVNQPKVGWKVDVQSLNEYMQIGNLNKNDMVKELIELRRKVKEFESQGKRSENQQEIKSFELSDLVVLNKREGKTYKIKISLDQESSD